MMTLNQLLTPLEIAKLCGPGDLRFTRVTKDSRVHIDGALCAAN